MINALIGGPPLPPSHPHTLTPPQLREVGRKYRTLSDEKQKEVEGLRSEVAALRRKLEEPPAPSEAPPPNTELLEKTQVRGIC